MRVVVDVMSGETSPIELIKGCVDAVKIFSIPIAIVGDESLILQELRNYEYHPDMITVIPSSEVVGMDEKPTKAIKRKKDASINIAMQQLEKGSCHAIFSPGNTGATVVSAITHLKRIHGLKRPALAIAVPNVSNHSTLFLDCGATVDVNPDILVQFALIGEAFSIHHLNIPKPRIGLLNVGREPMKGNKLVKETYKKLEKLDIDFRGNIEGNDLFSNHFDVCVTDGFNGNILLKALEGISKQFSTLLEKKLTEMFKYGYLMLKNSINQTLDTVNTYFNANRYGGAVLLGVDKIVVVGHGLSNHVAVKHGIKWAYDLAKKDISASIEDNLKKDSLLQFNKKKQHPVSNDILK